MPVSDAHFEHRIEIDVDRKTLREFLCNLERYRELHPLIETIEELPADPDTPAARRYRVVDRLAFGPIRFRSIYTASIEAVAEDEVHGRAYPGRGIALHSIYRLEEIPGGTRIIETTTIESPWYLRRYVASQARDSHRTTLARIKQILESPAVVEA